MDAIRSHKPPSPVAGCSKNKGDLWLERNIKSSFRIWTKMYFFHQKKHIFGNELFEIPLEWKKPKIWQNVRIAPKQGGFMPKRGGYE